jgi:hypothetical protein
VIPVFGCETARDLLEPFIDGELNTSEQVAVQTHLRTCPTCQARVGDMSLIGWSLRTGPQPESSDVDANALAVMQSGVLARLKVEREQSFTRRTSELLSDMRLLWPALGATAAVFVCLVAVGHIWRLTMERTPNSMAALLDTWGPPGTDHNPLVIDIAVSAPRVLNDGLAQLYGAPEYERSVTVRFVATQDGRVGPAEVVDADMAEAHLSSVADGSDVLNAVRGWQLAPAQSSRGGQPVAVTVVYMYWQTTAVKESLDVLNGPPATRTLTPVARAKPAATATPVGTQSAVAPRLTTV